MPKFGELLRRLRGTRPQREAAEELGMPVTTLSTLENQDSVPRGPILQKLCDYYGVSVTYFYSGVPSKLSASDSARDWLARVRENVAVKPTIAMYAPPEFPDDLKERLAEKIRQRKNANAPDSK